MKVTYTKKSYKSEQEPDQSSEFTLLLPFSFVSIGYFRCQNIPFRADFGLINEMKNHLFALANLDYKMFALSDIGATGK